MDENGYSINDRIQVELDSDEPNVWRIEKLKRMAQTQFNLMVKTGGQFQSQVIEVQQLYDAYSALPEKDKPDYHGFVWSEADKAYIPSGRPLAPA